MSLDVTAAAAVGAPITDVHRQFIFSFIRTLRGLDVEKDAKEMVVEALAGAFGVDPNGVNGKFDAGVDAFELFAAAAAKGGKEPDASDEKYVAFLDVLTKKGYFAGAPEGSDEYKARLAKAAAKYKAKSNPYEGLSADQLKEKGNELVGKGQHKEALGYYTKAIELAPENHILYANRAAAHTHLKDYSAAVSDCERSVSINPSYAKAFSRLGTARFYEGNYRQAVDAFTRASDLDPANENYKRDLEQAKDKLAATPAAAPAGNPFAAMAGMPGMGGMGGMPNVDSMMQMMSNPAFQQMASNMMQNPDFMNMVSGMATRMGSQAPSVDEMNTFLQSGASEVDADGNMRTPFGMMPRADFDRLRAEQLENPKMRAIMEDVRTNGMAAMTKYMGDPDVMASIQSLMGQMRPTGGAGGAGGAPPAGIQ